MNEENKPREFTKEEMKHNLLSQIETSLIYWENEKELSTRERMEGLAFSILVIIDGASMGYPSCELRPAPHPDDKEFNITNNENYYPDHNIDIAGELHEIWHKYCSDYDGGDNKE